MTGLYEVQRRTKGFEHKGIVDVVELLCKLDWGLGKDKSLDPIVSSGWGRGYSIPGPGVLLPGWVVNQATQRKLYFRR